MFSLDPENASHFLGFAKEKVSTKPQKKGMGFATLKPIKSLNNQFLF